MDWNDDYDEPEEAAVDPSKLPVRELVRRGAILPGARHAYRHGFSSGHLELTADDWGWDKESQTWLEMSRVLLDLARDLPQAGGPLASAGFYGTKYEAGPDLYPFIRAAFETGVVEGVRARKQGADYGERFKLLLPSGQKLLRRSPVRATLKRLSKTSALLSCANKAVNEGFQAMVIQHTLVRTGWAEKKRPDISKLSLYWGGSVWRSGPWKFGPAPEPSPADAVELYLSSGAIVQVEWLLGRDELNAAHAAGFNVAKLERSGGGSDTISTSMRLDDLLSLVRAVLGYNRLFG